MKLKVSGKTGAIHYDVLLLLPDIEDFSAIGHLSSVAPRHLSSPGTDLALDMLAVYSVFLTLLHDHDWEPGLLRAGLKTPAHFVGSLGSRRTHVMSCETLRQMRVPEESLTRLRGPIGLVPSLRDASSIAVSALAEIVAAFQDNGSQPHFVPK